MFRISVIIIFLLAAVSGAHAANRYWIAGAAANWNSTTNWSATSGGASGASVPGSGDVAIFDANGTGNCVVNAAVDVLGLTIQSAYTGTISQGTYAVVIRSSDLLMAGGTWSGGTGTMTLFDTNSKFDLTGGTFNSPDILELKGDYNINTGTFTHNSGHVKFIGASASTSTITGSTTFYDLTFSSSAGAKTYTIGSTTTLTVVHNLVCSGTSAVTMNTGIIDVQGDVTFSNTSTTGNDDGNGTTLLKFSGSGNNTLTGSGTINQGKLPIVEINKSGGTLTLASIITTNNNWTHTAGTVSEGTSTVVFAGVVNKTAVIAGAGALNFYNLILDATGALHVLTIKIDNTTVTVKNNLTFQGFTSITTNAGTTSGVIQVEGNVTVTNTSTLGNSGSTNGTALIKLTGSNAQVFTGPGTINMGKVPAIEINKTGGTLTLAGIITTCKSWNHVAGTVNPGSSQVTFTGSNATLSISGKPTFNKMAFYSDGVGAVTVTISDTVVVTDTLKYLGTNSITLNTGVIAAQGNALLSNTMAGSGGTALILINGTGSQVMTGYTGSTSALSRLPNVRINKSSGTLYLKNTIAVAGDWTYTAGTINGSTYNGTVFFTGNKTITGTHALHNITFDGTVCTIASGTTLTANGTLSIIGGNAVTLNTGVLEAQGDIIATNTTSGVGNATLRINGTGTQTITGYTGSTSALSRLPNVEINKTSGTLYLVNTISVAGNWTYIAGTINEGTSTVIFVGAKTISGSHPLYNAAFAGAGTSNIFTISNTLTVNGLMQTSGSSNISLNTGTIAAKGDINLTNTGTAGGGSATIDISGTGSQTLTGNGTANTGRLCHVIINKASGTLSMLNTISCAGNWTYTAGTVDANPGGTSGSTVAMCASATVDAQGTSSEMKFRNLTIYGGTSTLGGNLETTNNLTISTGTTLTAASTSYTIKVGGNWSNSGTFTTGTGAVSFNGTGAQSVGKTTGTETFNSVIMNKSAGAVTFTSPVIVTNALTLTKGNITTTSTNLLTLNDNATASAGSDTSYITGPMKKIGNDVFTFPLGGASYYHPLGITAPSSTTEAFTIEYKPSAQALGSAKETSLQTISSCDHWTVTRNAGTSLVKASAGWNSNCGIANPVRAVLAGWNGTQWTNLGNEIVSVNGSGGVLTAAQANSFSSITALLIADAKRTPWVNVNTVAIDSIINDGDTLRYTVSGANSSGTYRSGFKQAIEYSAPVGTAKKTIMMNFFSGSPPEYTKVFCEVNAAGTVSNVRVLISPDTLSLDTIYYDIADSVLALTKPGYNYNEQRPYPVNVVLEGGVTMSPNGDSSYDTFVVQGTTGVVSYSLTIKDIYGNTIFQTTNPAVQWNGTNGSSQLVPADTYIYEIVADGQTLSGQFTLEY